MAKDDMRFHIIGGGPAGLYFAYLIKKSFPAYAVRVFEQNNRDVTFGFGVVLSGRAQAFLAEGDPAVVERLGAQAESWTDQHIVHRGETIPVDGSSYSGIERIVLLRELQDMCTAHGVEIAYGDRVRGLAPGDAEVVVAADGANSSLREAHADAFGTRHMDLKNYFAWYGVEHPYPAHTLTFKQVAGGGLCAHHYRYKPGKSTFVAEADQGAWEGTGLYAMDEDERRRFIEQTFADTLGGKPLLTNRSMWKRWHLVTNDRWSFRNIVLIGDALRTAHPSIGSGTRLAMEDSIALWRAFEAEGDNVAAAFQRYERERRPIREKLDGAALKSIDWYERMADKMPLSPLEFAHDYLLRTGVMTPERLERYSPKFLARYRAASTKPL